jgi:hypothetical protein
MRTGGGLTGSGLRNKFPELPVSGVKKPAPVAVGRGGSAVFVVSCSSGEVRLIGGGREGNNSSISGTDPAKQTRRSQKAGARSDVRIYLEYISPQKPPRSWG